MNFVAVVGIEKQIVGQLRISGHHILYIAGIAPSIHKTQKFPILYTRKTGQYLFLHLFFQSIIKKEFQNK